MGSSLGQGSENAYDLKGVVKLVVSAYYARNRVKPPWDTTSDDVVPFMNLPEAGDDADEGTDEDA